jgi:pyrroloquinoline quinone (PQQ) biosynthesis protein C
MATETLTSRAELATALRAALSGRELLEHPFYRRWSAGRLGREELAEYACQYRAFEAALPAVLDAVRGQLAAEGCDDAAALVARNLADELGHPEPHLELFDKFADSVRDGEPTTPPGPAAVALVDTYRELAEEGSVAALAGLAAYEVQAPAIARSKADGLRLLYGIDGSGTAFWDLHAEMDVDHGEWALDALVAVGARAAEVGEAAARAAESWWALLDEREAEAPGSAELCTDD